MHIGGNTPMSAHCDVDVNSRVRSLGLFEPRFCSVGQHDGLAPGYAREFAYTA